MDEDEKNFAPDIDEVNELFFGDDDREKIDLSRGRPKKDPKAKATEPKKAKAKVSKETNALVKQANFLKKFEEKLRKRDAAEKKQKLEREQKKENKRRIKQKQEVKKAQPFIGKNRYSSIGGDYCIHDDKVRHVAGERVTTCCRKCSRTKEWSMTEWSKSIVKKQTVVTQMGNPDKTVFPIM
jgi:hypothetical protein